MLDDVFNERAMFMIHPRLVSVLVLGLYVSCLVAVAWGRAFKWRNNKTLVATDLNKYPKSLYLQIAQAKMHDDCAKGIESWKRAIGIAEGHPWGSIEGAFTERHRVHAGYAKHLRFKCKQDTWKDAKAYALNALLVSSDYDRNKICTDPSYYGYADRAYAFAEIVVNGFPHDLEHAIVVTREAVDVSLECKEEYNDFKMSPELFMIQSEITRMQGGFDKKALELAERAVNIFPRMASLGASTRTCFTTYPQMLRRRIKCISKP